MVTTSFGLPPVVGVLDRVVREEHADLVAGEHAVAAARAVGHGGGQAVGVGVVGEDELGPRLRGEREDAVHRARLLGVREGHGGEGAVGVGLRGLDRDALEAGPGERADGEPVADAVHRGVDDPQGRRVAGVQRRAGEAAEVGLLDRRVLDVHEEAQAAGRGVGRRRPGDRVEARGGGDPGGDRGVDRRDDLGAARQVDLVAVVAGRVVAGGDRDAGRRAEVRDGEGEQRRRDRVGEEAHGDAEAVRARPPRPRRSPGSSGGRRSRPRPRGTAGRGRRARLVEEVRAEAPGGLHDREPVHPVRGPPRPARAGPRCRTRAGPTCGRPGRAAPPRPRPRRGARAPRARRGSRGRGPRPGARGRRRGGRSCRHSMAGLRSGMLATRPPPRRPRRRAPAGRPRPRGALRAPGARLRPPGVPEQDRPRDERATPTRGRRAS